MSFHGKPKLFCHLIYLSIQLNSYTEETLVIAIEKDGAVSPCEGERFYKEKEEEKEEIE